MTSEVWNKEEDPITREEAFEAAESIHRDIVEQLQQITQYDGKLTEDEIEAVEILNVYENNLRVVLEYLSD